MASCLHCGKSVRAKQHALCCDGCNRWQHRLCETEISRSLYMATMRGEGIVTWHCRDCTAPLFVGDHSSISTPDMESTRLEAPTVQTATLEWTDDETIRDYEATETENEESARLEDPVVPAGPDEDFEMITDEEVLSANEENTRFEVPLDATFEIIREAEAVPDLDASFDITRREVQPQDSIRERSIQDSSVTDDSPASI